MVYVHYTTITIAGIDYVGLCFSDSSSRLPIGFIKSDFITVKKIVEIIKQIPPSERVYDPISKIWTIPTPKFATLSNILRAMQVKPLCWSPNDFDDFLAGKSHSTKVDSVEEAAKVAPKAEDFFYTQAPIKKLVSEVEVETALCKLFDLSYSDVESMRLNVKKLYRQAAKQLHPDLNGGDASKMTELNYYFQQYKTLGKC
jgi:hypothetical protein